MGEGYYALFNRILTCGAGLYHKGGFLSKEKITANAIAFQANKLHFAFLCMTFSYKTRQKRAYFLVSLTISD